MVSLGHFHHQAEAINKSTGLDNNLLSLIDAGPIVRIAPNEYSIDDINAAKTIYGHSTQFLKV